MISALLILTLIGLAVVYRKNYVPISHPSYDTPDDYHWFSSTDTTIFRRDDFSGYYIRHKSA